MKVIIDSISNVNYASFYIEGMRAVFGRKQVSFSSIEFKGLQDPYVNLRFILDDGKKKYRCFIHTMDSNKVDDSMYEWCDVYGSVNANFTKYPKELYPKIVSLAPSFSVKCYRTLEAVLRALRNFVDSYTSIISRYRFNVFHGDYEIDRYKNVKAFFGDYYKNSTKRMGLESYTSSNQVRDYYVFFMSTLWSSDEWNKNDVGVNLRRANFIRACKAIDGLEFDGGLLASNEKSNVLFEDCKVFEGVRMSEWIEKTKASSFVFNTPAFWDCHGWKLGEYLALGKAIISTKLVNDLPSPLVHGQHIHYVSDDMSELQDLIRYMMSNRDYAMQLEAGAAHWWQNYGTPQQSINILLKALFETRQ